MNLKRPLIFGVLIWIISLAEVLLLVFVLKLGNGLATTIHFAFVAILTLLMANIYFKDILVRKSFGKGIFAGFIFMIMGLALDLIISVPVFVKSYGAYFLDKTNYLIFGELILFTGIVGKLKSR